MFENINILFRKTVLNKNKCFYHAIIIMIASLDEYIKTGELGYLYKKLMQLQIKYIAVEKDVYSSKRFIDTIESLKKKIIMKNILLKSDKEIVLLMALIGLHVVYIFKLILRLNMLINIQLKIILGMRNILHRMRLIQLMNGNNLFTGII